MPKTGKRIETIDRVTQKLREKESILDGIPEVIMVVAAETYEILDANRAFLDHYNLDRNQVIGKRCHEATHQLGSPCLRSDGNISCPLEQMILDGRQSRIEHIHRDRNGKVSYHEISAYPIKDADDRVTRIIHLSRDITERKIMEEALRQILHLSREIAGQKRVEEALRQSKERLDLLVDTMNEGLIIEDQNGVIHSVNQNLCELLGYAKNEIIGHSFEEFFRIKHPRHDKSIRARETGPHVSFEAALKRKDGKRRNVSVVQRQFHDGSGRLIGIAAFLSDVTELTLRRQRAEVEEELEGIVGRHALMKKLFEDIREVCDHDFPVMIHGESGTGKELVAKAIHGHSKRKDKPFVPVDCSTLVENLFESELFGHVKGSFTGATATKHGRLELANGGTIFFDEISNIGINVQAKLLRAIQEKEIFKVGSNQAIQIDIRIIAATNADLREEVKEGRFREDLFYRLGVVPIHLPPLRERKSDIPLLVNYFIDKLNKKRRKSVQKISQPVMQALTNYDWPGNIRELENAIERAIVLTDNDTIEPKDLYYYGLLTEEASTFKEITLNEMEKQHITNMLALHHGHKIKTAQALGINRKTLRLKMKKYGIS